MASTQIQAPGGPSSPSASPATRKLLGAARMGRLWDVRSALAEGADPNAVDSGGLCVLATTASHGEGEALECCQALLEAGALVDGPGGALAMGRSRPTPLMGACAKGWLGIARLLIERGADASRTVDDGATALIWAAWEGKTACVELLLRSPGSDPLAQEGHGMCALALAANMGHSETVALLAAAEPRAAGLRDLSGSDALCYAVKQADVESVAALLPISDLSAKGPFGETAIELGLSLAKSNPRYGALSALLLSARERGELENLAQAPVPKAAPRL